jgi:hypothetical protein
MLKVRFFSEPHVVHLYDFPSTKIIKAHIIFKPTKRGQNPNPIVILDTIKPEDK